MIPETEGDGGKPTEFEVCDWCGFRRLIEIRPPDEPEDQNECPGGPVTPDAPPSIAERRFG